MSAGDVTWDCRSVGKLAESNQIWLIFQYRLWQRCSEFPNGLCVIGALPERLTEHSLSGSPNGFEVHSSPFTKQKH